MNQDTIYLLRECNAGFKSATNSMEQVIPYISDEKLKSIIDEYNDQHIKLGDECHQMLNEYHEEEKDAKVTAKAFSWLSTETKLLLNHDASKIAEIMLDGCHMGIKSVSRYLNQYKAASDESINLAKKLVQLEQEFMNALLEFL